MIKVIFCGYRDWAKEAISVLSKHSKIETLGIIKSKEEYDSYFNNFDLSVDIIVFIGWSWFIPKNITKRFLCVGIHPSDLPEYRGGSPLQHQIIDGITSTKTSLMTLGEEEVDSGEVWLKEDLSLEGNSMEVIFENLTSSSIKLMTTFFNNFNSLTPKKQDLNQGMKLKRRTPHDSRITLSEMQEMTLLEIYNFIRALTDPYPNAFLEDENGNMLLFKSVEYQSKS
jgi:methionyl-tRNA formyltransferase